MNNTIEDTIFITYKEMSSVKSTINKMEDEGLSVSKVDDNGILFIPSVYSIPLFKDTTEACSYWDFYSNVKNDSNDTM